MNKEGNPAYDSLVRNMGLYCQQTTKEAMDFLGRYLHSHGA